MLFQKRQQRLPHITGLALGDSFNQAFTRDFPIEAIYMRLKVVVSGAIATATADGLQGIAKNIRMTTSDGGRTRTLVDFSGRGLLEMARNQVGVLDENTELSKDATGTATYYITYPLWFTPPQLSDPIGSFFLLPTPRFNENPSITVQLASQADIDRAATPTFAVTSIDASFQVMRRFVDIPGFPAIDTELIETTVPFTNNAANQAYELQVPGYYAGILMRCYTSATARGDISIAGGGFRLELLGNTIRDFELLDIQTENGYSETSSVLSTGAGSPYAGSYYLDFITDKVGQDANELGSLFGTNQLASLGARARIIGDIAGAAGAQIKFGVFRMFGDLSALQMGRGRGAKK